MPAQTFDVVIVVWGEQFLRLFLDVCVPNQLTPGNLGALPPGSRYRVFTTPEDVATLESSPALEKVGELMPLDIIGARHLSASGKSRFSRMTECHRQALRDARDRNAALIFLCADHLLSEGAFAAVVRRHSRGSRAVMCTGLRVCRDEFLAALARGDGADVSPRDLVSTALGHLHAFTHAHVADGVRTAIRPIGVYWTVPGEGLLARCIQLHPLMVDPLRPEVLPEDTIDGHYVRRACPSRSHVHVVTDSDELVIFEMSKSDEGAISTVRGKMPAWRTAAMLSHADSHQQWYWSQPVRLHVRDVSDRWRSVERRAVGFAARAVALSHLRRYAKPRRLVGIFRRDGLLGKPLRRAALTRSKRLRRSVALMTHVVLRGALKIRKRAARAGRRVVRRVRPA